MKTLQIARSSFLSLLATGAISLAAQTTTAAKPPIHHTTTTAHAASPVVAKVGGCATGIPVLSPKIPALPAGATCPKPLYTVTTVPAVKLDYVSPMEGPGLRETLGLEESSFTLAYVDIKAGTGALAQPHKWYSIHYTGYLTDGTKFDSSLDRGEPISINYGQHMVIPGWDTGFDGMRVGGKRRLFIPFQLAYGPNGKPPTIPAKAELIFDVELVAMSDTKPEPKESPAPAPAKAVPQPVTPPAATPPATTPPATTK